MSGLTSASAVDGVVTDTDTPNLASTISVRAGGTLNGVATTPNTPVITLPAIR